MKPDLLPRLKFLLDHFESSGRWDPNRPNPPGSPPDADYRYPSNTFWCDDKNNAMDTLKEAIEELDGPWPDTSMDTHHGSQAYVDVADKITKRHHLNQIKAEILKCLAVLYACSVVATAIAIAFFWSVETKNNPIDWSALFRWILTYELPFWIIAGIMLFRFATTQPTN